MRILRIDDDTYKRLTSLMNDLMHLRRKNMSYDDILNELIDIYQESVWGSIGGTVGGG